MSAARGTSFQFPAVVRSHLFGTLHSLGFARRRHMASENQSATEAPRECQGVPPVVRSRIGHTAIFRFPRRVTTRRPASQPQTPGPERVASGILGTRVLRVRKCMAKGQWRRASRVSGPVLLGNCACRCALVPRDDDGICHDHMLQLRQLILQRVHCSCQILVCMGRVVISVTDLLEDGTVMSAAPASVSPAARAPLPPAATIR